MNTKKTHPQGIVTRMMAAFREVTGVGKKGDNTGQNYKYVKEADVSRIVKTALANAGIFTVVDVLEVTEAGRIPTKWNSAGYPLFQVHVSVTYCSEFGESIKAYGYGHGMDSGDKGLNKAITSAVKYIHMKTFLMPTDDDLEKNYWSDRPDDDPYKYSDTESDCYKDFLSLYKRFATVDDKQAFVGLVVEEGGAPDGEAARSAMRTFFTLAHIRPSSIDSLAAAAAWVVTQPKVSPEKIAKSLSLGGSK